jgi:polar amino acid transport system substrate-binding protein
VKSPIDPAGVDPESAPGLLRALAACDAAGISFGQPDAEARRHAFMERKMPKTTGRVLAAVALLFSAHAAHAQSITFLTEENPPFNFAQGGKPAGMSVDVVNEMIKRAGITASFEILAWDTAYRRAQADKDTCLYSTARIENRERVFGWIGPIAINKYVLVAKNDFPVTITSAADVRKYKIGAVKTDAKAELLRTQAITNIVESDTEAQIPPKLFLKKDDPQYIDMWVSGLYTYKIVAEKAKITGLKMVYVAHEQPLFLACSPRTSDAAFKKLNDALQAMRKDGSWNKLIAEGEKRLGK